MMRSALVIIPSRNEAKTVGAVIDKVRRLHQMDVVVVDDASTDDTVDAARAAGAHVIPLVTRLGAWGATQTGIRFALARGYRYVVTMDADGQHEPEQLPEICQPVLAGEADVCIGACVSRGSIPRKIAWFIMKKVSGLALEDITSGFRTYNTGAMELLAGREATLLEYQDIGVLALLRGAGLRIAEVDVTMLPRSVGASRVFSSWMTVAYYMCYSLVLAASKRGQVRGRHDTAGSLSISD